jgi:hypothetical protein
MGASWPAKINADVLCPYTGKLQGEKKSAALVLLESGWVPIKDTQADCVHRMCQHTRSPTLLDS